MLFVFPKRSDRQGTAKMQPRYCIGGTEKPNNELGGLTLFPFCEEKPRRFLYSCMRPSPLFCVHPAVTQVEHIPFRPLKMCRVDPLRHGRLLRACCRPPHRPHWLPNGGCHHILGCAHTSELHQTVHPLSARTSRCLTKPPLPTAKEQNCHRQLCASPQSALWKEVPIEQTAFL